MIQLGIHSQLHMCVKSTIISQLQSNLHHIAASHYREGVTMGSSVVESCGHGAAHWFRDWPLVMGMGVLSTAYMGFWTATSCFNHSSITRLWEYQKGTLEL